MGVKATAASALCLTAIVAGACALLPAELAPPVSVGPVNVDPQAACVAISDILVELSFLLGAVQDALEDRSTEALLAASRARANIAASLSDARVEYGDALPAAVEDVAAIVSAQADVLDHGRVELATREALLHEGRATLEALDGRLQRIVGPGSPVARVCPEAPFEVKRFALPDAP